MSDIFIAELKSFYSSNPKNFTSFRKDIEKILKDHIKPLTKKENNINGTSWRIDISKRFKGRGAKWFFVSLENIEPTLKKFESDCVVCETYRKNITKLGKAWIRFSGTRIRNGNKCAAFEVRTKGSTIDHPKQLHLVCIDDLDSVIEIMPGTPKALKLEEDSAPKPYNHVKNKTKEDKQILLSEKDEVELPNSPNSNDPEDWEAFLEAEGLVDFENDVDYS